MNQVETLVLDFFRNFIVKPFLKLTHKVRNFPCFMNSKFILVNSELVKLNLSRNYEIPFCSTEFTSQLLLVIIYLRPKHPSRILIVLTSISKLSGPPFKVIRWNRLFDFYGRIVKFLVNRTFRFKKNFAFQKI